MLISIFAPTGSGKTELAIKIAKSINAEIINCDSIQIYKDLKIGSASPSINQLSSVKHHLYNILPLDQKITVGKYLNLAKPIIDSLQTQGIIPLVVGGTSLYLTCLIEGLANLPQDQNLRSAIQLLNSYELDKELKILDPNSAKKLHPNDIVRRQRALEVAMLGVSLVQAKNFHQQDNPKKTSLIIVPTWDRTTLYERINQRTKKMIQDGLLEESRWVLENYPNSEIFSSIGYKQARLLIKNKITIEQLYTEVCKKTRNFAKRQLNWLRNEPVKKKWHIMPSNNLILKEKAVKDLKSLDWSLELLVDNLNKYLKDPLKGVSIWFVSAKNLV